MKTSDELIENILRQAPQPRPPAGLKRKLLAQAALSGGARSSNAVVASALAGWLRRWWPALMPTTVSVVCAVVLTVQQEQIRDLQAGIQSLSEIGVAPVPATKPVATLIPADGGVQSPGTFEEQIGQLKLEAARLAADVKQLELLRAENAGLRAQLAAAAAVLPPELQGIQEAREKAMRIQCVNNLKQLGLASRVWANDNADLLPPDILSMTNEMNTPKILVCPSDSARQPAADWASFTPANCSYEFLAPSGSETEPTRVLFRCPIHGTVGLVDGSVQQISTNHPDWFIQRDGKLYLEIPAAAAK